MGFFYETIVIDLGSNYLLLQPQGRKDLIAEENSKNQHEYLIRSQ